MNKALASVLVLFLSASAFAMPKVGDDALYDVTKTQGDSTVKGAYETQLVSFDSAANVFNEKITVTVNGQSQSQTQQVDPSGLLTDDQVNEAMSNCSAFGGKTDKVTVPAGTFDTCSLQTSDGSTIWISNVSFGLVKEVATAADGSAVQFELRSQRMGQ